jgi:hypothetical protein
MGGKQLIFLEKKDEIRKGRSRKKDDQREDCYTQYVIQVIKDP